MLILDDYKKLSFEIKKCSIDKSLSKKKKIEDYVELTKR